MTPKKSDLVRDAINLTIQGDLASCLGDPIYVSLSPRAMEALSLLFRDYRMYQRNEKMQEEEELP